MIKDLLEQSSKFWGTKFWMTLIAISSIRSFCYTLHSRKAFDENYSIVFGPPYCHSKTTLLKCKLIFDHLVPFMISNQKFTFCWYDCNSWIKASANCGVVFFALWTAWWATNWQGSFCNQKYNVLLQNLPLERIKLGKL